jgi:phosphoglycerate dehydrogenase-like enzyme
MSGPSDAGGAERPLVLFDPFPRSQTLIFTDAMWQRLNAEARVISHEGGRLPDATVDAHIDEAALVIGQTDLPRERLDRAAKLRAIINVEGNFLPNVDYARCFARGINVLGVGPAFAVPVAEMGIAFALDLARGVTTADQAFRQGAERYGLAGNADSFLLTGCEVGIIGFGNLGQALLPLLQPFRPTTIRVFDPWLPEGYLRDFGPTPAPLDEVLSASRVIFVLAGVTSENRSMIGAREFALIPDGAAFVLLSRADVVDWDAFMQATRDGRIRAATDVFPEEPAPSDEPARTNPHVLLSAHRAGGVRQAFHKIGEMTVDDALLILQGLPPVRLQAARAETVGRMRSKPGRSYKPGEVK